MTLIKDKTEAKDTAGFQKGVPLLPRAGGSPNAEAAHGKHADDDKKKPVVGMPEGYEPDTSVTYVAGKEGKDGKPGTPDQVKNADGTTTLVSAHNSAVTNAMEILPEGHTYRDRVEAQARALGVEVVEGETLELLMWKIRMQASS